MTKEEELQFLKACGEKLSELTADKRLGAALVMFFDSKRIHCISNLSADRAQSLLAHYVTEARGENGSAYVRESVWLVLKGREIDNVSLEKVVAAFSTKAQALEFRHKQVDVDGEWWCVEEQKVDCDD